MVTTAIPQHLAKIEQNKKGPVQLPALLFTVLFGLKTDIDILSNKIPIHKFIDYH